MAKKRKRKYSPGVGKNVEREMRLQKRNGEERPWWKSRESEEPQAGHRDRTFGGAQGRQESAEEEIARCCRSIARLSQS